MPRREEISHMDYEAIIADRNEHNVFAKVNGIKIAYCEEGHSIVDMTVTEDSMNLINSVHGGCLYTMADVAAGSAASSYGPICTTVNSSFSYLRPAIDSKKIVAEGTVVKRGRRVLVINVEVRDEKGTVLCTGIFTYMPVHEA